MPLDRLSARRGHLQTVPLGLLENTIMRIKTLSSLIFCKELCSSAIVCLMFAKSREWSL